MMKFYHSIVISIVLIVTSPQKVYSYWTEMSDELKFIHVTRSTKSSINFRVDAEALRNHPKPINSLDIRVRPLKELLAEKSDMVLENDGRSGICEHSTWDDRLAGSRGAWCVRVLERIGQFEWMVSCDYNERLYDGSHEIELGQKRCSNTRWSSGPLQPGTEYFVQYVVNGELRADEFPIPSTEVEERGIYVMAAVLAVVIATISTHLALACTHNVSFSGFNSLELDESSNPVSGNTVTRTDLLNYCSERLVPGNNELVKQYDQLKKWCEMAEQRNVLTTREASKPANRGLNRYSDILAYDQTRVVLRNFGGSKLDRYINANYIYDIEPCMNETSVPVLNRQFVKYIAAQGPMENTIADFWEMLLVNNVKIIVMLTNLQEDRRLKCARYWPTMEERVKMFSWAQHEIGVTCLSEEENPVYTERRFLLIPSDNVRDVREVTQLHMTSWPDFGVPKIPDFRKLLEAYQAKYALLDSTKHPTLVHCSAGVGRTGTFIAADFISEYVAKSVPFFDIFGLVKQIRNCRMLMIQQLVQYQFLHCFVKALLEE